VAAVVGTVLVITFIMVCIATALSRTSADDLQLFIAWLFGARFDIAYTQFKLEFGKLMGVMGLDKTPEVVTEVHETLNKSEL
jgi:farnesyl-diphosphate farnesyltransferase